MHGTYNRSVSRWEGLQIPLDRELANCGVRLQMPLYQESSFSRPNSLDSFKRASSDRVSRPTHHLWQRLLAVHRTGFLFFLDAQLDYVSQTPLWLDAGCCQSSSQGMTLETLETFAISQARLLRSGWVFTSLFTSLTLYLSANGCRQ